MNIGNPHFQIHHEIENNITRIHKSHLKYLHYLLMITIVIIIKKNYELNFIHTLMKSLKASYITSNKNVEMAFLGIRYKEARAENNLPVDKYLKVTSSFNFSDNAFRITVSVFFMQS